MICTRRPPDDLWKQPDSVLGEMLMGRFKCSMVGELVLSVNDQLDNAEIWSYELALTIDRIDRIRWCPKRHPSMYCCGNCVEPCAWRCIGDIQNRLAEALAHGDPYRSEVHNVLVVWKSMVECTNPSDMPYLYNQLCFFTNQWICGYHNSKLRKYMRDSGMANPYKVSYEPLPVIEPVTSKVKVNPETGVIKYHDWPVTGQCPYCLPTRTIDLRRIKKGENRLWT